MRGAVAAPQPRAAEVGAAILAQGGNAFDAGVATAFAQMIADPWMCGVAGHSTATLWPAQGEPIVLEMSGTAGSKVREDMWAGQMSGRARVGAAVFFDDFRNELGHTAVCTPGTVAGLEEIHRRFCTMSWEELLQPAIRLATEGVRIPPFVHDFWSQTQEAGYPDGKQRLSATAACAAIYLDADGELHPEGHLLVNTDYARTLEAIARGGAREFYEGEIAQAIAVDMEANGGFVTLEDLKNYKVRQWSPLVRDYRSHQVVTAPPPVGGPILLQMLNVLSGYELSDLPHNGAEYLHLVASAMKLAHADRRRYMGDPDYVEVPLDYMLAAETAAEYRERIAQGQLPADDNWDVDHDHTTHVSVYDEEGNCAAITHSLGSGSGVVTPGLGFVYNNSMKHFNPEPGTPNSIQPGKARIRSACPTVVLRDGKPRIVVGAPGGSVIISSVLQTILNIIDHEMSAVEAVSAPRIHCEGGAIFVEARVATPVVEALQARGHAVDFMVDSFSRKMSAAHAVHIPSDGGRIEAGADPRRGSGIAFSDGEQVTTWGWLPA